MTRIGIIAEYNPFHIGHARQIATLRNQYPTADIIVAMSGSFVQRGVPAVISKWQRATWAIRHVDLVIEIPTVITLRSAASFADGAVRLLAACGCTHLAFGAEHPSTDFLTSLSCEPDSQRFHQALASGKSYPVARLSAIPLDTDDIGVNDILAAAYIRSIRRHAFPLTPIPLPRLRTSHINTPDGISGSIIRQALIENQPLFGLEDTVRKDLENARANGLLCTPEGYEQLVLPLLRTLSFERLAQLGEFSEGLEHRFYRERHAPTLESFWQAIKSKRYPHARIRRLTAQIILGITRTILQTADQGPHWIRPLALHTHRSHLLRDLPLPILHRVADAMRQWQKPIRSCLAIDLLATDFAALTTVQAKSGGQDYYQSVKTRK